MHFQVQHEPSDSPKIDEIVHIELDQGELIENLAQEQQDTFVVEQNTEQEETVA